MIEETEIGRVALELPVVVSSVAIPAGLALGKSGKFAIRMATVGIAGSAGSNWIQPRQRLGHIVKAREAVTCVRREFNFQKSYEQALTTLVAAYIQRAAMTPPPPPPGQQFNTAAPLTTATLGARWNVALGLSSGDSLENARIAVGAADDVVSRLKARLVEVGSLPDFSSSLAAVRTQYENAQAKAKATTEATKAFSLVPEGQSTDLQNAVQKVKEYPARVAECVAKVA